MNCFGTELPSKLVSVSGMAEDRGLWMCGSSSSAAILADNDGQDVTVGSRRPDLPSSAEGDGFKAM